MNAPANLPRILLIDSNVYFSKRLGDALKQHGFDVVPAMQGAYALTMLERNTPSAIICATNLREMGAFEIAPILHADPKTASIPLIAVGSGGDQALLEAYRAGCDDFVDRRFEFAEQRAANAAAAELGDSHVFAFNDFRINRNLPELIHYDCDFLELRCENMTEQGRLPAAERTGN